DGIIEYCEAFNNGWDMAWTENGPVGIWIWDCTDFIIQYCISHHNRTNPVAADGGGFDLDGGVSNSVIQYCISHNNEGAGFGLYEFGAAKPWENNTIRYNISQDDGIINGGSLGIWKADNQGVMRNCLIYNNTFYNSRENGSCIWLYDHYPGYQFYNNVFVYNGSLISEGQSLKDEFFLGNLYWNLSEGVEFFEYASLENWARASGNEMHEEQLIGLFRDPVLKEAGSLVLTDPAKIDQASLTGYVPQPESPLVDRGLDLRQMFNLDVGEKDLAGTAIPLKNNYDIGAIELDY
ncbi:MAG: right-handed parallel beta-helix repeat-containing protein, partial [Bacteroidota bacterium]|nr:right-handed parallel beta-helix repeat-containing protein [Bacteroidota bacterium]